MNKNRLKNALEDHSKAKKDLIDTLSKTMIKIEHDLSTINLNDKESQRQYNGLMARKNFAKQLLKSFGDFDACIAIQQDYIIYLEYAIKEQDKVIAANPLSRKLATLSIAKSLAVQGMSEQDISYCLNLRGNAGI